MVALPQAEVVKRTDNQNVPDGLRSEHTEYGGEHSRVFRRLGMDLLALVDDGSALVHAPTQRFDQMMTISGSLEDAGPREQARWATIKSFVPSPMETRVDRHWLNLVPVTRPTDVIIELQPVLGRGEVEEVVSSVLAALRQDHGAAIRAAGRDFSGRYWYRLPLHRKQLEQLAESFYSIQSLHHPLTTPLAISSPSSKQKGLRTAEETSSGAQSVVGMLPTVAVVDGGVPEDHVHLRRYCRGRYRHPEATDMFVGDHGSHVASRVVFGDFDVQSGTAPAPNGSCNFLDVIVPVQLMEMDDKALVTALDAVIGTSPDVRVFNCSFGNPVGLRNLSGVLRRERLAETQDLDNLIFARDVLVVMAAGNSPPGVVPAPPYPEHLDLDNWALGHWASGFNTLVCGSQVTRVRPEGIVTSPGMPSPFTRVGPGIAAAPVPGFAEEGGDGPLNYVFRPGLGVSICGAGGQWEEQCGTSLSAPLLARQAAYTFAFLQRYCEPSARIFSCTVKAVLALTARLDEVPPRVRPLAKRTLGRGRTSSVRLQSPDPRTAVFIWQGVLDSPSDIARVRLPIPKSWLSAAKEPRLRVVCSWDAPVNSAVPERWATRRVGMKLHPDVEGAAVTGSQAQHFSYPLFDRWWDLSDERLKKKKVVVGGDDWALTINYEEIADAGSSLTFTPQQRVAFAAELVDVGEEPVSPQAHVQALPITQTMVSLGTVASRLAVPVVVRGR